MIELESMPPGKYVVAVSGGVDSVVLLDLLLKQSEFDLIVAHFDHGIREDSRQDAEFVRTLAQKYKLPFEVGEGKLGAEASEEAARSARYKFLRKVKKLRSADAIITAHHQDDQIETAIINLLRGTYRKGLSSLKSGGDLIRPLLHVSKHQLLGYAKRQKLEWREDSTNTDIRYLRNYVRHQLVPTMAAVDDNWRQQILGHIDKAQLLNQDINDALDILVLENVTQVSSGLAIERNWLIMLPSQVGREVLVYVLQHVGAPQLNSQQLQRALIFCKTALKGKRMEVGSGYAIAVDNKKIIVGK